MMIYLKLAGAAAVCALFFWLGGLAPKTALEAARAAQAQTLATALLKQRSQDAAQAAADNKADATHDQDIAKIDSTPARVDPLIVYRAASPGSCRPVPGAAAQAGPGGTDPAGRGSEPADRDGVDRRAEVEALKAHLERVMADYRRLDAEWPK